ncbi:hypothetical protein PPISBEST_287 [Bacillus phage PPIsBest]|uniref:Uncharacterized protein n=2 Tax=Wphvirus TaxID=1922327 RepID=A0A222Z351_9CAUD|nr:hypothetical protein PPISBEST_287 [Bacillus phage PPIsBest]QDH50267.1 hypothetical protein ALPS_281 [Bacillus phage ALPS]
MLTVYFMCGNLSLYLIMRRLLHMKVERLELYAMLALARHIKSSMNLAVKHNWNCTVTKYSSVEVKDAYRYTGNEFKSISQFYAICYKLRDKGLIFLTVGNRYNKSWMSFKHEGIDIMKQYKKSACK